MLLLTDRAQYTMYIGYTMVLTQLNIFGVYNIHVFILSPSYYPCIRY